MSSDIDYENPIYLGFLVFFGWLGWGNANNTETWGALVLVMLIYLGIGHLLYLGFVKILSKIEDNTISSKSVRRLLLGVCMFGVIAILFQTPR